LTRRENFVQKFSAALGISLRSDHDHDLVALFGTLGFECECLLFPVDVELYMILAATSIVAPVVFKNCL
jgi:hypothetical protein